MEFVNMSIPHQDVTIRPGLATNHGTILKFDDNLENAIDKRKKQQKLLGNRIGQNIKLFATR